MYGKLRAIAETIGGEVKQEFDQLLQAATGGSTKYQQLVAGMKALLNGAPETSVELPAPTRGRKSTGDASPNGQWLSAMLTLIMAKANGAKEYEKAMPEVCRDLKLTRKPNRLRMVGSMFAHSHGKFRKEFVSKLGKTYPDRINEDLAAALSKVDGKPVTLDQLKSEAGL